MDAALQNQSPPLTRPAVVRLPSVSTVFWITTVLAAGMGETASDFLFLHLPHAITLAIGVAGDLTAETLHLGFFSAGVLFAMVIAVPLAARRWSRLNAVVAFWFACIVARPLGASFTDWLALPRSTGALGWGTGPVALALIIAITGLVGYLNAVDRQTVKVDITD